MEETNGLRQPGDIGGPMDIGSGYRWNVPVVTYGFDQSFLDYFGTDGVAAVESAIQILNDLPPASQIVLTNYPFDSQQVNYTAQAQNLSDLKSETLFLLLEQMGLTQPTRYTFVLKQWTSLFAQYAFADNLSPNVILGQGVWQNWAIPDFIDELNFDPITLSPSPDVNNTIYTAGISGWNTPNYFLSVNPIDPFANIYTAVADAMLSPGVYYTGLTYDDVGGLRYLFSTNNVNYETLLPSVHPTGHGFDDRCTHSFVNGAWRPGIDKITFVPQPVNSLTGAFLPMTNQFTDTYLTNGALNQQRVARVISQPDFLFSVADLGKDDITTPWVVRTGTTNWINNSALNGNPNGTGPGVIQPPINIIFNNLGRQIYSYVGLDGNTDESTEDLTFPWGTFDSSTNAPILYPLPRAGTNLMTVRMWLTMGGSNNNYLLNNFRRGFEWSETSQAGTQYDFQTSTNMTDWITLFAVTNNGTVCTYWVNNPSSPHRFYRLVPQ